jgi:hypothetical protein
MSQQNARRLGSDEYRKRTSGRTLIIVAATSGALLFAKPVRSLPLKDVKLV